MILLFLLLLFAAFSDLLYAKIPNALILFGISAAVAELNYRSQVSILLQRIVVFISIFIVLYIFYSCGSLGAGDIKLLQLMSLYMDLNDLLVLLLLSFSGWLVIDTLMDYAGKKSLNSKKKIRMAVPVFIGYGLWYLINI